jgi:hypothetical protein
VCVYRDSIFSTFYNTGKFILLRLWCNTWLASRESFVPLGAESCSCVQQAASRSCVEPYKNAHCITVIDLHCDVICVCLALRYFLVVIMHLDEPGSSVSIVSGLGLDDRVIEVRSPAETKGFFVQPLSPDRLWGPPSLLYNGYRRSFPRGWRAAEAWRSPLTPT